MADNSPQKLHCPRCQAEYGTAEAQVVPAKLHIPARYYIECEECGVPFYTVVKNGADSD